MPRFLQPKKSTQHRVAAIALYRALLSRCTSTPLPDKDRNSLRNAICNKFRQNRKIQSPRQLGLVFRAGYETLERLATSTTSPKHPTSSLTTLISSLPPRLTRPRPIRLPRPPSAPSTTKHPLAVLPPDRAVLNVRPYAKTSGPRHVPILAAANGIPFLRLTKPQPPALSRVLRQKLDRKIERFHLRTLLLNYWVPIGRQEDEWDAILERECGFRDENEPEEGWNGEGNGRSGAVAEMPVKWADAMLAAIQENVQAYEKEIQTDKRTVEKMMAIVDAEMELAKREGQTVVRGRKRRPIQSRWLT
ncbi:hypothetical protein K458DRAFT_287291 [Lentithecium fluviatile CBS 122367]|uniref:Complex 1 LYR protein domain-containing protein n=1 Tax=Lentithecium fluviatile CBS 122367 TaxID=1168545 RepID=A0A6G1JL90_9PLEO|nr:hypothetical protein K458DRAFT_287291 [Lentithecium fluviatile CBS 122367]